ncbi:MULTISPECIES: hypothetical protein [unclassified Desulfovibrio]|uniref:hypothetical protein n=1 Tax=unclassified Desulfovibrio TaxID=2593640 RepID=UPI0013E9E8D4|nr:MULTISPECIES: hypothetical protein [unclassified Desulfovibrio]
MPLYHTSGASMPQLAQQAMGSATSAMAAQQKQTTTTTKRDTDFWDDFYKGARALNAGANAVSTLVNTADNVWGMYDKYKLRDAYDNIDKAFAEGGIAAIQNNPDMQDYHHSQALGQFMRDRANSQKGYNEMLKGMDEMADKLYQDWRLQAMGVRDAWQSGDMAKYMPAMQQLVASSPLPYRLELDGQGNFKEMFRSDEAGGWTATGRTITPEQAYNEMNNILRGEQTMLRGADMKEQPFNAAFNAAARRSYWGTMMGNAENRLDPKKQIPLYDGNGRIAGVGIIQNPLDDYGAAPRLFAYGKDGKQLGVFDGINGVMSAGLSPYRPAGAGKGGAGGSGRYSLSSGDVSILNKYATRTDPETGEKTTDYGTAAFLEGIVRQTGLTPHAAIAAFEDNVKMAMQKGASREEAERYVMARMGTAQPKASAPQQGQQPQGAATAQEKPVNPATQATHERMRRAATGQGENGAWGGLSDDDRQIIKEAEEQHRAFRWDHGQRGIAAGIGGAAMGSGQGYDPAQANIMYQNTPNGRQAYIVTSEGPRPISDDEVSQIRAAQSAEPSWFRKRWNESRKDRPRKVTFQDVEGELSNEEKAEWRRTGRLPARYPQTR